MSHRTTLVAAGDTTSTSGGFGRRLPRALARNAVIAYIGATGLGAVMRFDLIGLRSGIPFDHLLHAHSHTLYFGWGALGLLAAAIPRWPRVTRVLERTATGVSVLVVLLYVGFMATGYHPATIAISTAMMLGWYVVAVSWWRHLSRDDREVATAYRYGLGYLVASSFGVWALAAIQATDGSAFAERLAIHAFLLGFGWFFVFAVVGAMLSSGRRLGMAFDRLRMRQVLHAWGALAWVTFPLGVSGGPELWVLGPVARTAGVLLVVPGTMFVAQLWNAATAPRLRLLIRLAAMWFGVGVATTAAAAVGGSAALAVGGRQGVVIHLHAVFVGFVTPLLVLVLARRPSGALLAHHGFLAVMLGGLVAVMLGWPETGLEVAAVAAGALWLTGIAWALPLTREPGPAAGVVTLAGAGN